MNDKLKIAGTFKAKSLAERMGLNTELEAAPKTANDMTDRIGIVFDDSGSMGGKKIQDAHAGIEEFLRNCKKDATAVAVYPMNAEAQRLTMNLPAVAVFVKTVDATGGTLMIRTGLNCFNQNNLTRMIIFSDGQAGDKAEASTLIDRAVQAKIPIDTVFISDGGGYYEQEAEELLRRIANETDGIFLKFQAGLSNFATAFKYLSPGFRAMLGNGDFKAKLERGDVK